MDESLLLRERRFILGLLLVTGVLVLWVLREFASWIVLGLIVAHVVRPLHVRLTRVMRGPLRAAGVLVAGLAAGLVIPLVLMGYALAGDVADIAATVQANGLPSLIESFLARVLSPETAREFAAALAVQAQELGVRLAPALLQGALDVAVGLFVFGSVLFSVLVKRDALGAWLKDLLPMREDREERLFEEVGRAVDAVVYSLVVVAAVQAGLAGVVWWIAGLPSPVFWTLVMFVLSMVPLLGPFIVIAPAALWAYLEGDWFAAALLVVGGLGLVGTVDNLLRPWLISRKGGLDATLVLLSVLGGLAVFGAIGVVVGPLVVAIFLHVAHLVTEDHGAADPLTVEPGEATEPSA